MGVYLLNLALAGIAACLTHEGGHYLAALCFGKRIMFRFEWGKLFGVVPVPRWVWGMPPIWEWQQRIVALAGFGVEFLCAGIAVALGWLWLLMVASCHIMRETVAILSGFKEGLECLTN